ncbi:MAG: hypothetical protein JWO94_179 [Verrucomicrobiaceae bacterium]|nr:hypothetical protein [Verrucomicrobiaceae bacterium]
MSDQSSDTAQSRSGGGQGRRRRPSRSRPRSEERTSGNSGGHYNVTRREPQPTGFQKFLSFISGGMLGKPKPRAKPAGNTSSGSSSPNSSSGGSPSRQEQRPARENRPAQPQRAPREREARQDANPAEVSSERLYVGNLSYDATESDLTELFNGVGQVRSAEVVVNNRTQRSKGFAFVTMTDIEQARRAVVELSNKDFMGRPLQVSGAKPPSKDRDQGES